MERYTTNQNKKKPVSHLVPMAQLFNSHLLKYINDEINSKVTIDVAEFKEFCRTMISTLCMSCSSIICEEDDVIPFSGKMYNDLISAVEKCFEQLPD